MIRPLVLCGALALAACQQAAIPKDPASGDLSAELVRGTTPPASGAGICWATDITPAVIETVTDQLVATPAVLDAEGRTITPASYRSETHQKIVQDRQSVHFRAPCPETMTPEFIATLQRALKARGYYLLRLSGEMDAPTRDAIRRFQTPLGLDSPLLSLAGARLLGIVEADRETL